MIEKTRLQEHNYAKPSHKSTVFLESYSEVRKGRLCQRILTALRHVPMEHRYSARIEAGLRTLIYHEDKLVAVGRIKNYSKFGLFIETGYSKLRIFQPISLEIHEYRSSSELLRHRYYVRTIRKSEHGLGVEFEFIDTAAEETLKRLIRPSEHRHDTRCISPAVSAAHVQINKNKTSNQLIGSKKSFTVS